MTRVLAEAGRLAVGLPVRQGGARDPAAGQPLSVAQLQRALWLARAAADGPEGPDGAGGALPGAASAADLGGVPVPAADALSRRPTAQLPLGAPPPAVFAEQGVLRPRAGCRWVAVVGAHGGAGASTVALALSDAAAEADRGVHLVSCAGPSGCGLRAVASVELGVDPSGAWRTGRRGPRLIVDRLVSGATGAGARWPGFPAGLAADVLTVGDLEAGAARGPSLLESAAAVLLVCRASVPGVQHVEQLLGPLLDLRADAGDACGGPGAAACRPVLVAALGSGRWPGAVNGATGPLLRQLRNSGRMVPVPVDRHLVVHGPTGGALPRPVIRAGALLLRLLDGTTDLPPAIGSAQPAPGSLLKKDSAR